MRLFGRRIRLIRSERSNELSREWRSVSFAPGVKLESAPVTDKGPYTTLSRPITNTDGQVKMPASFHPSTDGCRIGADSERWLARDIGV